MNQKLNSNREVLCQTEPRSTRLHDEADAMLRDIAFVLKMTKRVREEITEEQESEELVLA